MSFRAVEHAGIREPRTAGATAKSGVMRLVNGKWVLDTDPRAEADGYITIVDGKPVVDDAASSGQTVVAVNNRRPVTF